MRKLYTLLAATLFLLQAKAQDAVNFTFTINTTNNVVRFVNTSTYTGDALRKALWSFGDGSAQYTDFSAVAEHKYAPGTYTACLKIYRYINHDSVLTGQECKQVTVSSSAALPATCTADFKIEGIASSPLARQFIALPNNSAQKRPLRICWRFGDGRDTCIAYTTNTDNYRVAHLYPHSGVYEACVTILYDGGCEAKKCAAVSVTVPVPPTPCAVMINEAAPSNGLQRSFYATTQADKRPEKICWTFGDGKDTCIKLSNPVVPSSLQITHRYPAAGVYHICATVSYAGGCTAQNCREIKVVAEPVATCSANISYTFAGPKKVSFKGSGVTNNNDHVITYRWTFGDGSTATGEQVSHEYASAGNYEACLTIITDHGCESRSCTHVVIAATTEPQLVLSPNPVLNELHLSFRSAFIEVVTVSIYNANGVLLRSAQHTVIAGNNSWGMDVSSLPAGLYSVVIRSSRQQASAIFRK